MAPFVYAATSTWDFSTSSDYTFDNTKIEFSSGQTQLKATSTPAWYSTSWKYRKKITIDYTKVSETVTNFPVLISRTDTDWKDTSNGGCVGQSDGGDFVFTSANGTTALNYEIETYTNTTGELIAWVNIPTLSSSSDTDVYIYYGNPSISDQQNPSGVWLNSATGIFHMKEDPSGSSPQIIDSSVNNLDGTSEGSMTTSDVVSGKIGNALDFDGSNDGIVLSSQTNSSLNDFEVPGGFTNTGLAYDSTEDVLWSGNFDTESIVKMSKTGTLLATINVSGTGIQGVTHDSSDDTLWYADYASTTIQHINKSGVSLGSISVSVSGGANGVAYESATDSLWVSGVSGSVIKRYSASTGTELQSLTIAAGSAFDGVVYDASDGTLWLTRDDNFVYNVSTTTGATIRSFTTEVINIEHIALDTSNNTLYVNNDLEYHSAVADGNRVRHYNKPSGLTSAINNIDHFTVSAWIYPTNVSDPKGAQIIFENFGASVLFNIFIRDTGAVSTVVTTALNSTTGQVANNNWYYLTATYDGSTAKIYKNGTEIATGARTRTPAYDGSTSIGIRHNGTLFGFQGKLDEVRVASTTLSAGFIATEYNNQNSPSTFYSVSSQQVSYDSNNPTIQPSSAITFTSLSAFSEIATKNSGEIKYQISNNGGTTWYWYNSGWTTTVTGYTEASTASSINTNIATFPVGSGSFLWRAYLHSDGTQLVQLDNIALTYINDATAPVRSAGLPSGSQPVGTTQVTLSLTTDESATCKYGTTASTAYASIATTFTTTGGTSHSDIITGLSNGQSYNYYVRCVDGSSNANTDDYTISFSIASPVSSGGGGGGFSAPYPTAPAGGFSATRDITNPQNITVLHFGFSNDITNIAISDNINFTPATYINATSSVEWTATTTKIIYVKYCNRYGRCSNPISLQINAYVPAPIISNSYKFYKNLSYRMTNSDVKELQKYLNAHGVIVAQIGAGSLGKETNYFGLLTYRAVVKFQEAHASDILTPNGLKKGTGYFGPSTRAFVNK